jgi:hypothetical protein
LIVASTAATTTFIVIAVIVIAAILGYLSGRKQERLEAEKNKTTESPPDKDDPAKEFLASRR